MFALTDLFSVTGRTALVTGGATGLGRTCAEALLSAGARVLIASRKAEACEAVARELSAIGPCEGFGGTVASEAGVAALAGEVRARTGALHILVNNAGVSWGEPFATYPWKAWERVMGVNVAGLFTLTRDLAPLLFAAASNERPATVVNIGSVMGTITQSDTAYAYSAAKAAVHHLTRILAAEFASRQVTVNAIAPGPFATNMTRFALGDAEGAKSAASAVPIGRLGEPSDIAGTLLYFTGRTGAYTSGAIVPVDGGIAVAGAPGAVQRPFVNAPVTRAPLALAEFVTLAGGEPFISRWFLVDQPRIDAFAEITEDWQFIHIDPEAARADACARRHDCSWLPGRSLCCRRWPKDALPPLSRASPWALRLRPRSPALPCAGQSRRASARALRAERGQAAQSRQLAAAL